MNEPVNRPEASRGRRSFGPTVAVGLAGAALATVGATSTWGEATTRDTGLRTATVDGSAVAPLVLPVALVALASWGTVLVLRRRGRRVVAVLAAAAGVAGAVAALAGVSDAGGAAVEALGDLPDATSSTTAWPVVAAVGFLLSTAAAVVAWWRAPAWPEMSARYDAPTGGDGEAPAEPRTDAELWKALDEGRDPTA
ncbi:Trp biosynthesis-associated membrane protein [Nocardioides caldifontis]|uniref:Trp biosynthesis-associated membrane protein n=1 Tax=Nocardioides caldifontis TaxID=2588938 RepID=UPI0013968C6A|nr:Trp biosynthesis-associated membrane protein [Nocardioides caldifontis]